ncbi:MAG: hypothetical protein QXQ41_04945 [Candidatus Bathyarchaeia archaeon]
MAGATIDHIVATTIFLAAMLIFVSLFNQTIQTITLYQSQKNLAAKCSDLLDTMLLNPGYPIEADGDIPVEWGKRDYSPTIFGLQDPVPLQSKLSPFSLSPFSLMRLKSSLGNPVYVDLNGTIKCYSNTTMDFGNYLLVSMEKVLKESDVAQLLGINGTYGFQLTLNPIIKVKINININGSYADIIVTGRDIPVPYAEVSYAVLGLTILGNYTAWDFDRAGISNPGINVTDQNGQLRLPLSGTHESYLVLAYARVGGLTGFGCCKSPAGINRFVVPLVESFEDRRVMLIRDCDLYDSSLSKSSEIYYNTTFVYINADFKISACKLSPEAFGKLEKSNPSVNLTLPSYTPGILLVTYDCEGNRGFALMPWGINAMAFPVVFGDDPSDEVWVATEIRNVFVGGIAYEAKLSLWSIKGYEVIS